MQGVGDSPPPSPLNWINDLASLLKLFDRQTKAVIERLGFSGGATDLFDRFVSLPCCGERATLGARGPAAVRRGSGFLRPLSVYSVV